jgi:hypothetical protein
MPPEMVFFLLVLVQVLKPSRLRGRWYWVLAWTTWTRLMVMVKATTLMVMVMAKVLVMRKIYRQCMWVQFIDNACSVQLIPFPANVA